MACHVPPVPPDIAASLMRRIWSKSLLLWKPSCNPPQNAQGYTTVSFVISLLTRKQNSDHLLTPVALFFKGKAQRFKWLCWTPHDTCNTNSILSAPLLNYRSEHGITVTKFRMKGPSSEINLCLLCIYFAIIILCLALYLNSRNRNQ